MTKKLFVLIFGLSMISCNEDNKPNSNIIKSNNSDGCIYTQNTGYRSSDSTITCISLNSDIPTFDRKYLDVSLFEYNPNIADVPACLVESKILKTNHTYGDTSLGSMIFRYSRSDSLRYYFSATLFNDSTLSNNNRSMYANPDTSDLIFNKKDTIKIKLLSL
jgi:hypothetical protein